jgi:hypothetical protein
MKKTLILSFLCSILVHAGFAQASLNVQKVRIFEHVMIEGHPGKTLRCRQGHISDECPFIEIVVNTKEIAIKECAPDVRKLNYQTSPLDAVYADFSGDCEILFTSSISHPNSKDFLTGMNSLLLRREYERRDPAILLKTGIGTLLGASLTLTYGFLTYLSIAQPYIPLWILTGPGTVMAANQTLQSGTDFYDEFFGQKRSITLSPLRTYFSLSSKAKSDVFVFIVPVPEDSFSRSSGFTSFMKPNHFELYLQGWRKLAKKLNQLQAEAYRVDGRELSELVPYPMP